MSSPVITDPTPEPTGLRAVVRDANGTGWVRWTARRTDDYPWVCEGVSVQRRWTDIPQPVTVLSEGVAP